MLPSHARDPYPTSADAGRPALASRRTLARAALLGAAFLAIPVALAWAPVVGTRETRIVSGTTSSPSADGPSDVTLYAEDGHPARTDPVVGTPRPARNPSFSQDNRKVRYLAYDSAAENLVPGDGSDGRRERDIILLRRTDLLDGTLSRASVNSAEQPAAGDSIKPSVDGQTGTRKNKSGALTPHCVVFQSRATNLDPRDRTDDWDVFLRELNRGTTSLVSVRKANATDGVVDGECRFVTFEAGGRVFVRDLRAERTKRLAKGRNPDQQTHGEGVAYDRGGQVYYRPFQKTFRRGIVAGRERLVSNSAVNRRAGGNGPSSDPNVNDNGQYVAFESKATDLCIDRCTGVSEDRNGRKSDVFRRTMTNRAPTGNANEMQMISYDRKIDMQGDLDSDQVQITGKGEQACFRSFAKNLRGAKFAEDAFPGPFMHIYFWNFPRERRSGSISGESKAGRTGEFKRAAPTPVPLPENRIPAFNWSCALSNRGTFIAYTSNEEGEAGETNGQRIPDMFLRFMGSSDEGFRGDF